MSTNLYRQPLPREVPTPDSGYSLKWAIAKRFGERDGSCNEGPFTFDESVIPWLEGVRDAGNAEIADEAGRLIQCIRDNPQGVEVWIGE